MLPSCCPLSFKIVPFYHNPRLLCRLYLEKNYNAKATTIVPNLQTRS